MLYHDEMVRHLRGSRFLRSASDGMLESLASHADTVQIPAGARLFEKAERGNSMYVVVDGMVRVHDGDVVLKRLCAGEVFGEIAALASDIRTSSVTAETDSTLLKIDEGSLYSTLATHPDAARTIIHALCEKERSIVKDVTERTIKVGALERELEIGAKIQRDFLPEALPQVPGWEMAAHLQPAREVAGDFYDAFYINSLGALGIVIGDVCDKGVGAALFMTLFRSLLRSAALAMDFTGWEESSRHSAPNESGALAGAKTPEAVLLHSIALTNNYIASTHQRSSMFASVFFGLLQPETGELVYVNAGHESPAIVNSDGIRQQLGTTGPVLGLFGDARHETGSARILPGESLVACTDGVTEAKNEAGEQFSEQRLLDVVAQGTGTASTMLSHVLGHVERFAAGAAQHDDITLLVLRHGIDGVSDRA